VPEGTGAEKPFHTTGSSNIELQHRDTSLIKSPEYFVDGSEAATFLKIEPRTLLAWVRRGDVPGHPLGEGKRKTWRFLLSELDAWLRARVNSARRPCSSTRRKQ